MIDSGIDANKRNTPSCLEKTGNNSVAIPESRRIVGLGCIMSG